MEKVCTLEMQDEQFQRNEGLGCTWEECFDHPYPPPPFVPRPPKKTVGQNRRGQKSKICRRVFGILGPPVNNQRRQIDQQPLAIGIASYRPIWVLPPLDPQKEV